MMHPTTRTDTVNRDAICDRELSNVKHLLYHVVDYDNATSYELESLVHRWYSAKLPILRVLSQSPAWDPERLCITSEKRVKVDYDVQATYDTIYDIARMLERYDDEARHHRIVIRAFYSNMDHDRDTTPQDRNRVSQDLADICALRLPHLKIVAGMKLTRALRAIVADADALDLERWETISWHDVNGAFCTRDVNHGMQWLLARFGDCIHPRDQRVTLHLSIAPTDILYSSPIEDIDGDDYFTSCHNLGQTDLRGGCYHAGVLSYLTDSCTAVLYSCDDTEERVRQKKSTRQMIHFSPDMLGFYSARIYPSANDHGLTIYREYRRAVQEMLSEALGAPNSWETMNREHSRVMVVTGENARQYPDYHCAYATPQLFTHLPDCSCETIEIGDRAYCLHCGSELDDSESCFCEYHREGVVTCPECGDVLDPDSWTTEWVGDTAYCCESCAHSAGWVRIDGEWYDADEYYECTRCECAVHTDNVQFDDDDRPFCDSCLYEWQWELGHYRQEETA